METKRGQIRSLTSLRFFASAAVVCFHLQEVFLPPPATLALGTGVSFFFVLSGFVLTYAHQDHFNIPRFYRSRVARLWPLHILTGTLALLVAVNGHVSEIRLGWPELANLFLLQAWIPLVGFVFCLNGVAWSISAEAFFYMLFPALRSRFLPLFVVLAAIGTAGILIALEISSAPVGPPWPSPPYGEFFSLHVALQFPFVRLLEFCLGIVAAKLFIRRPIKTSTALEVAALGLVLLFGLSAEPLRECIASAGWSHAAIWFNQCGGMLFFAFAIFIFAHEQGRISRILTSRFLVLLGDISFSTYMFHSIVLTCVSKSGLIGTQPTVLIVLGYLAVIYSVSWLSYTFVELPSKRMIEKISIRNRKQIPATVLQHK